MHADTHTSPMVLCWQCACLSKPVCDRGTADGGPIEMQSHGAGHGFTGTCEDTHTQAASVCECLVWQIGKWILWCWVRDNICMCAYFQTWVYVSTFHKRWTDLFHEWVKVNSGKGPVLMSARKSPREVLIDRKRPVQRGFKPFATEIQYWKLCCVLECMPVFRFELLLLF